jgi:parallel beta-helix repeat protein
MRKTRMRRIVSWIMFAFLLLGTLTLAFNVGLVHAQGETVYINSDGSVSPSDVPISSVDNVTYTFTGNIGYPAYNGIIVERNNTVIDGNGYTVQGALSGNGLSLANTNNVTIKNTNISDFQYGIYLDSSNNTDVSENNVNVLFLFARGGIYLVNSSNNILSGNNVAAYSRAICLISCSNNTVTENYVTGGNYGTGGIILVSSSNNIVSGNDATSNGNDGIYLASSSDNVVSGNNATANSEVGIGLDSSSDNSISGNNMTNNFNGIELDFTSNNTVYGNNMTNNQYGVWLRSSIGNTVSGNYMTNNGAGVGLGGSSNNTVSGNNITDNGDGVYLYSSSNNTISKNNITNNWNVFSMEPNPWVGVWLGYSSNNAVSENNITNNWDGIVLGYWIGPAGQTLLRPSFSNEIYHNNFINNTSQVSTDQSANVWDDGYPFGGNYWSDYTGLDDNSGSYQNETGYDWIGDSPYVIGENNTDRYPLMHPYSPETDEIETAYRVLLSDCHTLLANFTTLNSTCHQNLLDYSSLQSSYTSLQSSFNALNASYSLLNSTLNSLNTAFNDYRASTQNELNYTRDFLCSLTAITAILIATVLYLAKRKPKTRTID